MMRDLRFRLEAGLAAALLWLVGCLRPETASNIGGFVARVIGPWLPVSRVADANLRLALPELDAAARRRIVRGVWDNLGRTAAEFPHARNLRRTEAGAGWEVAGVEHLRAVLDAGGPAVFVAAHLANWEAIAPVFGHFGHQLAAFFRPASNPYVDRMIRGLRGLDGAPQFAKGAAGARAGMAHLKAGGLLGALIDQKMNDGIAVPLFGHRAMTAPAPATLALRFGCPIVPIRVERLGPARFRVTFEAPLAHPASGNRQEDAAALTAAINLRLEAWVRARPEQWLWLHRRWPKELMS